MGMQQAAAHVGDELEHEVRVLHAWRVSQLTRLGLATAVAESVADSVDWHEIAKLVGRGCPAATALSIVQ